MEPTTFRIACEAYDRLAGSEDWDAFGQVFDRVLDGLSPADQDLVGRLIHELKSRRSRETELEVEGEPTLSNIRRRLIASQGQA